MSDDNTNATGAGASVDPVHQLLQSSNNGQPMTAEQRNERREALLKRQKESREKAQQISQAAKANAANASSSPVSSTASSSPIAPTPTTATTTTTTTTTTAAPVATTPVTPVESDAPVRESMVQQAVSFLSSPSVQSADEAKKTQFLEKKGLTLKEIELARSRVAGGSSAPAPAPAASPASLTPVANTNYNNAPPPVPPRTYAPVQAYPQQQLAYYPQQQVAPVDPKAFQKKLVLALLISGGVTVLTSVIVQKLIYPMVRGITGARRSLVGSQTELLAKFKERLSSYKDYLLGLNLGSNHRRPIIKIKDVDEKKDTKTTVEDEDDDLKKPGKVTTTTTTTATTTTATTTTTVPTYQSTIKQLDNFSKTLEGRAKEMSFEQLKATRAMTQDLAEYITKETYALTTSIAYPTSRYYGYNATGAASSGKGGLTDPTTPEAALKSEIRSLKGLLLNWRNFPTAATSAPGSPSMPVGPSLVQQ